MTGKIIYESFFQKLVNGQRLIVNVRQEQEYDDYDLIFRALVGLIENTTKTKTLAYYVGKSMEVANSYVSKLEGITVSAGFVMIGSPSPKPTRIKKKHFD